MTVTVGTSLEPYRQVLRANSSAYQWLAGRALKAHLPRDAELALKRVVLTAEFAGRCHSGRFSDGSIENLALEIGNALFLSKGTTKDRVAYPRARTTRRRILHVATRVYAVGGHTRMLHHWIESDASSCHSLVLLNQANEPLPEWLVASVERAGGALHILPSDTPLVQSAQLLRGLAQHDFDLVVLNHHPHDVVPSVAFAGADGPPVILVNHADHIFWLGSAVADLVVNLRSAAIPVSTERRGARQNAVLPIPIKEIPRPPSREDARRTLGIPLDQIVLLSVGRGEKYRPCGPFDFLATSRQVLERHVAAHLYVVGTSTEQLAPYAPDGLHSRLHLVGNIEDPSMYHAAADIYLESFPFGSNTALLEAAAAALPVVPACAPLFPLLVANNDSIIGVLTNPKSEQEYVERVTSLVIQPALRLEFGQQLRELVLAHHVGDGWLKHLDALYARSDGLPHGAAGISISARAESVGDIGLSMRSFFADGRVLAVDPPEPIMSAVLRYGVYVTRDVGDFAAARWFAARMLLRQPLSQASWRLFAVALMGRAAKFVIAFVRS